MPSIWAVCWRCCYSGIRSVLCSEGLDLFLIQDFHSHIFCSVVAVVAAVSAVVSAAMASVCSLHLVFHMAFFVCSFGRIEDDSVRCVFFVCLVANSIDCGKRETHSNAIPLSAFSSITCAWLHEHEERRLCCVFFLRSFKAKYDPSSRACY